MATLYPYSQHLARKLANPPAAGAGRHQWLFSVACSFKSMNANMEDVQRRLELAAAKEGWLDRLPEIGRDIEKIEATGVVRKEKTWFPPVNPAAKARLVETPPRFDLEPKDVNPLATLFRPGEWVCVAQDEAAATTQRLEDVLPIYRNLQFMVANPMRLDHGRTQAGRISCRSLDNAVAEDDRRYNVIEFDTGDPLEAQAAMLSGLHTDAMPLVLVVFSGGKSLHGWFNVAGLSAPEKLRQFRRGALLGADISLWDRSKLVRMPGGIRENGRRQEILYWEPEHAA